MLTPSKEDGSMDLSSDDSPKPVMFFVGQAIEKILNKEIVEDKSINQKDINNDERCRVSENK